MVRLGHGRVGPTIPTVFGGDAFYLGHLGRVPVYVRLDIIFLALLVYTWAPGNPTAFLVLLIVMLLSILLHELGHAAVANARGMTGVSIVITGLGGYCSYQGIPDPARKLMISIAGPLVNFALAFTAYMVLNHVPLPEVPLLIFAIGATYWVNLVLGILNSVPIYPLDGGQSLLALLRMRLRADVANRAVLSVSVTAFIVGLAWYWQAFERFPIFIALIGAFCLFQAFRDLR